MTERGVPAGPVYESGFRSLEADLAAARKRIARGRERADDRADVEELELSLRELRALYRADLRALVELVDEDGEPIGGPLDLALLNVEELIRDDLTLRTIPQSTRDALREQREADYALVLYGLAGAGASPLGR